MTHDAAFKPPLRPSKSGYNCSIAKFPEWKGDPPAIISRKPKVEGEIPPAFKQTYKYRSRPTSSIVTNRTNLKAAYPSIFRSFNR